MINIYLNISKPNESTSSKKKTVSFRHTTVASHPAYQNIRLQLCFSNIRSTVSLLDSKINSGSQTSFFPFVCSTSKINIETCVVEYWFIALEHQSSAHSTSSMTIWTWKYFNLIKFRFLPIIKVDESVTLFAPASRSLWTLMNGTWWRLLHRYLFIRVSAKNRFAQQTKTFCWCGEIDFESFFIRTVLRK